VNGTLQHGPAHHLELRLRDANGTRLAEANASGLPASLPVPEGLPPGAPLQVAARPVLADGRTGAADEAATEVEATPPALRAALAVDGDPHPTGPLRVLPNHVTQLDLTLDARGVHGNPPTVAARLLDWEADTRRTADCGPQEGPPRTVTCTLDVPRDLPVGRYTLQAAASGPGGTTRWNRSLEAGAWLDVSLPEALPLDPTGEGGVAGEVPVRNAGNVPAGTLHLALGALEGPDDAAWRPPPPAVTAQGIAVETTGSQGGVTLSTPDGPLLAPGQGTRLEVSVPLETGVPPGDYTGAVAVTATLEARP
jgi:hypothetical protein